MYFRVIYFRVLRCIERGLGLCAGCSVLPEVRAAATAHRPGLRILPQPDRAPGGCPRSLQIFRCERLKVLTYTFCSFPCCFEHLSIRETLVERENVDPNESRQRSQAFLGGQILKGIILGNLWNESSIVLYTVTSCDTVSFFL